MSDNRWQFASVSDAALCPYNPTTAKLGILQSVEDREPRALPMYSDETVSVLL